MLLSDLKINESGFIEKIFTNTSTNQRILEIGLIPGVHLQVVQKAPLGGPIVIQIDNTLVALRFEEAQCIQLKQN